MSYGGISYFAHSFSQEYEYATQSSKLSESSPLMVDVHLVISSINLRRITLKGLNKLTRPTKNGSICTIPYGHGNASQIKAWLSMVIQSDIPKMYSPLAWNTKE